MHEYTALVKLRHKGADGRYRNIEEGEIFSDISEESAQKLLESRAIMDMADEGAAQDEAAAAQTISPEEQAEIAAEITGTPKKRGRSKK